MIHGVIINTIQAIGWYLLLRSQKGEYERRTNGTISEACVGDRWGWWRDWECGSIWTRMISIRMNPKHWVQKQELRRSFGGKKNYCGMHGSGRRILRRSLINWTSMGKQYNNKNLLREGILFMENEWKSCNIYIRCNSSSTVGVTGSPTRWHKLRCRQYGFWKRASLCSIDLTTDLIQTDPG